MSIGHCEKFCGVVFLLLLNFVNKPSCLDASLKGDPDFLSSGLSWTTEGIPSAKVGNGIRIGRFLIGGMFEARNEARFHQEFLPNHNWRGVGCIEALVVARSYDAMNVWCDVSASHESAHPTMGIRETTDSAYELIYDDVYRRMILNAINVAGCLSDSIFKSGLFVKIEYHCYFLSKNTPELAGNRLARGDGVSCGAEYRCSTAFRSQLYASIFDRIIFQSGACDSGLIHVGNGESLTTIFSSYPIIRQTNTIVVKCGLSYPLNADSRAVDLYFKILYGSIYGFIDSRDIRTVTSFGIDLIL